MNNTAKDVIYLLACAVNGISPDKERIRAMDMEKLYEFCKWHTLRAAVHTALKSAGVTDHEFEQAYNKAVRKNIMLDVERTAISEELEKNGIWYMPLKGSILKDLYPENGMREMADNDVLYDSTKQQKVKELMLSMGYTAESVGKHHHDTYMKPPVLNFELHTVLFGANIEHLHDYYREPQRLMIQDEGKKFGYHMSDEDFYVYVTAHEYKHFSSGGTGIRNLLDCYVYVKSKGDSLDWKYITEQCRQMKIDDFESSRRALAIKVFSSSELPVLNDAEQALLEEYIKYGTYGTVENHMAHFAPHRSKTKNILRNMFPSMNYMKTSVKFVGKCPFLYPLGVVYRWGRVLLIRRKYLSTILKVMKKNAKEKV